MTIATAATCVIITVIQINTLLSYAEDSISPANPNITATNMTELEMLKKEKEELLESLIEAVEDTKGYIWQNNGSTSLTNLTNIKGLFENYLSNSTPRSGERSPVLSIDRRQGHKNYSHFFPLSNAAKGKHKQQKKKKHKERELQRIIMQGKIDEWLLNRELEKRKIKSYKSKVQTNDKVEICPREGISKKKKKSRRAGESTEEEKERQKEEKKRYKKAKKKKGEKKRPCCRKCCKRSYMGCL